MKLQLNVFLAIVLSSLAFVAAQNMPEVVQEFTETQVLWDKLHRMQLLIGDLNTSEAWRQFLQDKGKSVIDDYLLVLPTDGRGSGFHFTMKPVYKFVANPTKSTLPATSRHTKAVAQKLITSYAEHLDSHAAHIAAVREHMALPDDAEHLLWD